MTRPHSSKIPQYTRILKERGLLEHEGAQSELARLFGVSRAYINGLVKKMEELEDSSDPKRRMK